VTAKSVPDIRRSVRECGVVRSTAPALALVLGLAAAGALSACGPWGPQGIFAGGPFLGTAEARFPDDWSFSDDQMLVAIETRGRWLRHSVTILCVAADGKLYVMSRHAPHKRWVQDIVRDPRVRLRVGARLYEGRAVRVDADPAERDVAAAVARAFLRKYVGIDAPDARPVPGAPAPGDDRAEVWTWRIDPPEGAS
jgi:hypothetical protein